MTTKSKNPKEKRDYKKEYERDQSSTARKKYRAELQKENRKDIKAGTAKKGDGLDQAHVKDVRKGGKSGGKLVAQAAAKNRAWRKGKKGYDR